MAVLKVLSAADAAGCGAITCSGGERVLVLRYSGSGGEQGNEVTSACDSCLLPCFHQGTLPLFGPFTQPTNQTPQDPPTNQPNVILRESQTLMNEYFQNM